jgi:predicted ATPase
VVTGGPGAGKTTMLLALRARGYTTVPDSARANINERKSRGLSPRPAPPEFAYNVLRNDIDQYRAIPRKVISCSSNAVFRTLWVRSPISDC